MFSHEVIFTPTGMMLVVIACQGFFQSIGSYAAVLHALNNMDSDLLLIAKDDEFGRKLQDLALPTRRRAPKKGE